MSASDNLKVVATVFGAIPIAFFLIFAAGELSGGVLSGLIHLVQALPIVLVVLWGWYQPKKAGWTLIALGVFVGTLYVFAGAPRHFPLLTYILAEIIIFLPIVISGAFYLRSAQKEKRR